MRTTLIEPGSLPPNFPECIRAAISSIAALLGAQRRIFVEALAAGPPRPPRTIWGFLVDKDADKQAAIKLHIVDVFPVPGGLKQDQ